MIYIYIYIIIYYDSMDDVAERSEKRASIWVRHFLASKIQGLSLVVSSVIRLEDLQPPFRPRKKVIFQLGTASAHLAVEAAQLVCDLMVKRGIKRWCFIMRIYIYKHIYIHIFIYIYISQSSSYIYIYHYISKPQGLPKGAVHVSVAMKSDLGWSWMI